MRKVAVIGGVRTPFCRSHTAYAELTNLDMMTTALSGLSERFGLKGKHVDEVVGGAVVTHAKDWNLAREAVIGTDLAPSTPGITMMQACGTSLQAALGSGAKIATGQIDCAIATGSDTVSDAPIVFNRKFAKRLINASRAKSFGQKIKQFGDFKPGELAPQAPNVNEPRTGLSMGQHCELMAKEWDIPRAEQDLLAYNSHKNAAQAYKDGFLDDMIVPCAGVFQDNIIREDIDLEKIGNMTPAFDKSKSGTLTAANSTPLTDGASARVDRVGRLGEGQRPCPAGLHRREPDGRYRFRRRPRAPDGADHRGVKDARPSRSYTTGLRLLRNPRSLRRAGSVHAQGLGIARLLP